MPNVKSILQEIKEAWEWVLNHKFLSLTVVGGIYWFYYLHKHFQGQFLRAVVVTLAAYAAGWLSKKFHDR